MALSPMILRRYFREPDPAPGGQRTQRGMPPAIGRVFGAVREEDQVMLRKFRDDIMRLLLSTRIKTITGTITVSNLATGNSVNLVVDHSAKANFAFCEYPRFTAIGGIDVLCYPMLDISGTSSSTTGAQFCIKVTNQSLAAYSPSFTLSYSRVGMQ